MYLKDLLKYRNVWLGFAMVWIVLFHTNFEGEIGILNSLRSMGYGGVDICLFASGIGCYYSLSANNDAVKFLKRRLIRIMPTYLIFIVIWLIYKIIVDEFGIFMAIGNLFAVQEFTSLGNSFNWYISAILLFYILTPYLKSLVDKLSFSLNILFIVMLVILSLSFWCSDTYIVTVARLPIFYLGIFTGKECFIDKKIKRVHVLLLLVSFVVGVWILHVFFNCYGALLWSHGLYWYPFILITPPLCVGISYFSMFVEKVKICSFFVKLIAFIGKHSFEVYLVHILLIEIIFELIPLSSDNMIVWIWLAGLVCLVFGCYLLVQLTGLCNCVFAKFKKKFACFLFDK